MGVKVSKAKPKGKQSTSGIRKNREQMYYPSHQNGNKQSPYELNIDSPGVWTLRSHDIYNPYNQSWHMNPSYQDNGYLSTTRSVRRRPIYANLSGAETGVRTKSPMKSGNGYNRNDIEQKSHHQWCAESSLRTDVQILKSSLQAEKAERSKCKRDLLQLKNHCQSITLRLNTVSVGRDKYLQNIEQSKIEFANFKAKANETAQRQQQTILELQREIDNLRTRLNTMAVERDKYRHNIEETKMDFANFEARANETLQRKQQTISELQRELDDLRTRLSATFGAKLLDNNPNIADLSDRNRPTKLAERFSELYDNEWTNCFEVVSKRPGATEKDTIQILLKVCLTIFEQCRATAAAELTELTRAIDLFNSKEHGPMIKNLKDSRKKNYQSGIKRIEETMEPRKADLLKTDLDEVDVKIYWHKCVEICWLMAIQDPPVSMETNAERNGEVFDHGRYRHYTKAGKYIDFIVWPALNVTAEGSILYKGVAQGKDSVN